MATRSSRCATKLFAWPTGTTAPARTAHIIPSKARAAITHDQTPHTPCTPQLQESRRFNARCTHAGYGLDEHRDDRWYGPYPDMIRAIASKFGFIINITEPPLRVLAAGDAAFIGTNDTLEGDTFNITGSSFDACVFAAGLGYVDICVAEFGLTAARRRAADFYTVEGVAMCAAPPAASPCILPASKRVEISCPPPPLPPPPTSLSHTPLLLPSALTPLTPLPPLPPHPTPHINLPSQAHRSHPLSLGASGKAEPSLSQRLRRHPSCRQVPDRRDEDKGRRLPRAPRVRVPAVLVRHDEAQTRGAQTSQPVVSRAHLQLTRCVRTAHPRR